MRTTPFTVAEESLAMSSRARGLQGMERTSAPMGPNLMDSGGASKPNVNTQPFNNSRLEQQNLSQNVGSAMTQAGANAVQETRKLGLVDANADYKANAMLQERKSEILSVMNAPATLAMGNMSPPDMAKFRQDIATGKAMAMGVNPDLVQSQMTGQAYA